MEKFIGDTMVPRDWKVKALGFGCVRGEGSTFAEVMAFQCLVITIQALVMNKSIPIDECLGIPTCQRVLSCSNAVPSLEKNMRIYLKRNIEKEKELWNKPTKLVKIAIDSSLHEGSSGDWHEPPCKRIKSTEAVLS